MYDLIVPIKSNCVHFYRVAPYNKIYMSGPSGLISELIQSSVGAERICMDISDVKELLNKGEKVDVECKESDSKLSKSIWDK